MATIAKTAEWDARDAANMRGVLDAQRASFTAELPVTAATRRDRLNRALDVVLANKDRFAAAMSEDFGHRSTELSLVTDIMASIKPLKHALKHLDAWMKPEKRRVDPPLNVLGAKARIDYQPKGVIGAIATWNFPVWVPLCPLGAIFAAGNRCMVKLSEFTPHTSVLLQQLIMLLEKKCVY